jgi:hypothetical protein
MICHPRHMHIYESGPKQLFLHDAYHSLSQHSYLQTSCQNFKGRPKTEYQTVPMTDIDNLRVIYIDASSHRVNLAKHLTAHPNN